MIYIVSLNPSVDYDLRLDGPLTAAEINQAVRAFFRASGKGANVAKMLANLGEKSAILGFVGGFTGAFIENDLQRRGIETLFTHVDGTTRINVKLNVSGTEHEITGIAPQIDENALQGLFERLKVVKDGDFVVLTGSVPKNVPSDIYKTIALKLPKSVTTLLDTRGAILERNVCDSWLVKPNLGELREMFPQTPINSTEEIAQNAQIIRSRGVSNVIVSLGKDGAVFVGGGHTFTAAAPKGVAVNTMGCGDSVVAGFLYAKLRQMNDADAFKYAVACGSATAFSEDMGEKPLVERLAEDIELSEL